MSDTEEGIFLDHSTLSTFGSCPEKGRLAFVEGYRPVVGIPSLDFGSAFHAGVAGWGYASSNFVPRDGEWIRVDKELMYPEKVEIAKNAFLDQVRKMDAALPLSIQDTERRSIERGLNLVEAYCHRWKSEVYEYMTWKDSGRPYVEIPFRVFLFEWYGTPVFYCGIIDSIKRSRVNGKVYINETKTTSLGLTQYVKQIRPNHQITGYHYAASEILAEENIGGTVWDCTFVSDRKGNDKGDVWMARGIDMQKDFARVETMRSKVDLQNWLFDITEIAQEYLRLKERVDLTRWPRKTANCHTYGGCWFRDVCSANLNKTILESNFKIQKWEPWKEN